MIIPAIPSGKFASLLNDINKDGFYCLNEDKAEDIFGLLRSGVAARFARRGKVIPNIEMKFSKNKIEDNALSESVTIGMNGDELSVSPLELQVAFKEEILKSPKDMEDARHIRKVAEGHLDGELVEKYRRMLHGFYG